MAGRRRDREERNAGTPTWAWVLVGCVGVPVLLTAIGIVIGLFTVLLPKGQAEAAKIEDMNRMRRIAGLLLTEREMPLAPDGHVDVYKVLRDESAAERRDLCFSSRLDSGPTEAQINAGDYSGFPWARHMGRPSRDGREVLLLWEKAPIDGHRVVVFGSSAVKLLREDEFQGMQAPTGR